MGAGVDAASVTRGRSSVAVPDRPDRIERLVAEHAAATPYAVAVQQGDRSITYAELTERANGAAEVLADAGVGPGDFVPVRMRRSPELVAVLLGVLTTGAAYIAMDPGWPAERLAEVVRSSGARLAITDQPDLPLPGVRLLTATALDRVGGLPPRHTLDGSAPACVFYTSGSTGRPKGVVSPHQGTIRTLVDYPTIPLDRDSVFLQAAPLPWDGLALELWAPLLNGGRSVLLDHTDAVLDTAALRDALRRGVNSMWLTSSLFNVFAEEAPELFGALRLLLVGGERLSVPHIRRVVGRFPELRLVNGYGPAEGTIFATTHVIRPVDVDAGSTEIPIGRPVPRTGVLLVDPDGIPVPPGTTGEIAISGAGLAAGYLGDPAETARRFVRLRDERHYRTGDLAVLDSEGILRYRGRADRQFKIRGVRIEPGEVEAVLEAHPRVASCCVVRLAGATDRVVLACAYTSRDGADLDGGELRDHAARSLLDAMVPTVLHRVPQLPLGVTGKVDPVAVGRLLAELLGDDGGHEPTGDDGPLPAAGTGRGGDELLRAARALLRLPSLADGDDLLLAGASSLDVIRLAARASTLLGAQVTIAEVYRLRSLAALRGYATEAPPVGDTIVPGRRPATGPVPLSRAQSRFWMAEQAAPGSVDNMIVLAYQLAGPLDPDALRRAIGDVVARHTALRTLYPWSGDLPEQRVLAPEDAQVEVAEVSGGPAADPRSVATRVTADWWRRPFDLEEELPIRARLCRLDSGRHLLCLHLHHIAFDGWSESLLVDDLRLAYRARLLGEAPCFPDTPSYLDYSGWEQSRLGDWVRDDLPYWRRTLARTPPPVLPPPADVGQPPRRESTLRVSPAMVGQLTRAAALHGGPPTAALLTATGRALTRVFDRPDVCLGTTTAGRLDPALEPILGYFVNPLTIPLYGVRDGSPRQVLDQAARQLVGALAHGRVPFDELVRVLGADRTRHPWFQTWVVLQRATSAGRLGPDVTLSAIRVVPPVTTLELMFEAVPQPDGGWELILLRRADGVDTRRAETLLAAVEVEFAALGAATEDS
ncbi:amino acid adenylation domain-containing protein [Micromonospora sp. NPDC050417]|uniref:amino acid adenylation domain-containing protein n=1 Tax=Micromonospora sp. NPDC050417 TaxID=3364280 RepID=UPI00379BBFB5